LQLQTLQELVLMRSTFGVDLTHIGVLYRMDELSFVCVLGAPSALGPSSPAAVSPLLKKLPPR